MREVWRKAASEDDFPKPRKLSTRRTVWVKAEVLYWIESKVGRRP